MNDMLLYSRYGKDIPVSVVINIRSDGLCYTYRDTLFIDSRQVRRSAIGLLTLFSLLSREALKTSRDTFPKYDHVQKSPAISWSRVN